MKYEDFVDRSLKDLQKADNGIVLGSAKLTLVRGIVYALLAIAAAIKSLRGE